MLSLEMPVSSLFTAVVWAMRIISKLFKIAIEAVT